MTARNAGVRILASGKQVVLRDRRPSDVDSYLRRHTNGKRRFYDAPWEGMRTSVTEEEARVRHFDHCRL